MHARLPEVQPVSRPATGRRIDIRRANLYGGAAPFTPASLSGLILWLRADLGITLAGAKVSAWADQSGNGNDFTQAVDARRPTFTASDANFNNQAVVTGAATAWLSSVGAMGGGYAQTTVCTVFRDTTSSVSILYEAGPTYLTAGGHMMDLTGGGNCDVYTYGVTGANGRRAAAASNTRYHKTVVFNHAAAATQVPIVYSAGVAESTTNIVNTGTNGNSSSLTWNLMGRSGGGASFEGAAAEFIAYNRALTAAEALQLYTYTSARYGA